MLLAERRGLQSSWHNSLASRKQVKASRKACGRSHRLPIVATSEFWWEDEQEFDALTEVLLPKQVVIGTPYACQQHLQQLKAVNFVAAFTSPEVQKEAEELWEQLGRAGPPLFLKVRSRAMLQDTEQEVSASSSTAAEQFWQELTGQSWRMDLDYGLNKDATLQGLTEQLLVVVSSGKGLKQLVGAALGTTGSSSGSDAGISTDGADVCMLQFSGWNQGEKQQQLQSWKQLQPRVVQLGATEAAVQG